MSQFVPLSRTPLGAVRLRGRLSQYHTWIAGGLAISTVIAMVVYFAGQHIVAGAHTYACSHAQPDLHSAFDHSGLLGFVLVFVTGALAAATLLRPGYTLSSVLGYIGLTSTGLFVYVVGVSMHDCLSWTSTQSVLAGVVFPNVVAVMLALSLANAVAQPLLYHAQRRADEARDAGKIPPAVLVR